MPNIYIKTRMRKMPDTCRTCLDARISKCPYEDVEIMCRTTGKYIANDATQRPAWCPLVEMEGSKT